MRRLVVGWVLLALGSLITACAAFRGGPAPLQVTALYAPESSSLFGAVATGYVSATRAAVQVLESGGNAVDAAVTAAFVAGAAAPACSGLGGETYIVLHLQDGCSTCIEGSVRIPLHVSGHEMKRLQEEDRLVGCQVAAVPGTPAALDHALRKYGTRSLAEALAPAIATAEQGFVVTDMSAAVISPYLEQIRATDFLRLMILKDGHSVPLVGDRICLPELARTMRRMAVHGVEDFYRGAIARQIDADMRRRGGHIRLADLGIYRVRETPPLRGTYRGREILTFPWPGCGGAVVEALNILEAFSPELLREVSVDRMQAMIEAFHIAIEDHYRFNADLNLRDEYRDLSYTTKDFGGERAALIRFGRPLTTDEFAPASRFYETQGGTTQISVADRYGNTVSLTQTLGRFYGGKAASPGLGFPYNSMLEGFDHTRPLPLKARLAPPSDMAPTIVLQDGELLMALGSASSSRIPAVVSQTITHVVDCGMGVRDAVLAPRVLWGAGKKPGPRVEVIDPIDRKLVGLLEKRGYRDLRRVKLPAARSTVMGYGAVNAVLFDRTTRMFTGVGDPRRQGFALGPRL